MHAHQLEILKAELGRPEYNGLSADAAYELLKTRFKELARTQFMARAKIDKLYRKVEKPAHVLEASAELLAQFKGGVPGFPNIVKRVEFDQVWTEK